MADREQLAWAAGIMEGEGSFSLAGNGNKRHPDKRYCRVAVGMTDEDIIRRFAEIFGMNVNGPYIRNQSKPMWHTATHSFELSQAIVAMLWPWLGTRRKAQAKRMLLGQTTMKGRRLA